MQNNDKSGLSWSTPSQPAKSQDTKSQSTSSAPASSPSPSTPMQKTLPPGKPGSSNTAAYAGILVAGIIIGVLVAWGYSAATNHPSASTIASTSQMASGEQQSQTSTAPASDTTGTGETTSNLITLPSPQKAGLSVAIDKVTVAQPTWVVVYDNVGGKPGNALGATLVFSTGPATVTLLRTTQPGTTYFVGLSTDNGDHKFAKATDPAVLAPDGSVALTSFAAN